MDKFGLIPDEDDIVIHANVAIEDVLDAESLTGKDLGKFWPQIVSATHIDFGDPYLKVNPSIFMPPDLNRFLAIRCRAVSALDPWGPNVNGDGFPEEELVKSCHTLIGKGFYIEHASHDPRNAVGIIAHAQWIPQHKYVVAVALVDKVRHPDEARMIRKDLSGKTAGVSIGCVAGAAQCSVCGHVARKRYEICSCMDRSNPFCKKGKRLAAGVIAHDVCKDLTFYELSHTKAPADRAALPYVVLGAEEKPAGPTTASTTITIPDEAEIAKMLGKEVDQTVKSAIHKMLKAEADRRLAEELRTMQQELRPIIRKLVREYHITK